MATNSFTPVNAEAWHREIQELSTEFGTFPLLFLLGYIVTDLTDEQRGAAIAGAWEAVRELGSVKGIDTPGAAPLSSPRP